jgi:hypothetical protein
MSAKIAAVALALIIVVAFSGCIGGNESTDNTTGYTNTASGNNPESIDTVDPEVTNQINSELMNETDSVEIGEMI